MKTSVKILIAILIIIILGLVGFIVWDKIINKPKTDEKTNTTNTTNVAENNTVTNSIVNTNSSSTTTNTTTTNKATTPDKLVVSREGMQEEVPSKEFSSTYGYTIRYATDYFKTTTHDDQDWFERTEDANCVVVKKENISYSKKLESLSNYTKTTVNGYEAVYIDKHAEGQIEKVFYVNTGTDYAYEITTSCQGTTEYLEGLGHIMDAMVQTFAVK